MFNTLRVRLMVFFIGLAVVPLLVAGALASWLSFRAQEQQALALQHEISLRVATQIQVYVEYAEKELYRLARTTNLNQLPQAEQEQLLSELLADETRLDSLVLIDAHGREQAHKDQMRFVDVSTQPGWANVDEFTQPVATRKVYYGTLQFDPATSEPLIPVAFPLTNLRTNAVEGVLVGNVRIKAIWELIQEDTVNTAGQTTFVTDPAGRVIAHALPSVVFNSTTYTRPHTQGVATGLGGGTVLMAWEPARLGEQTLYVIAQQPFAEALGLALSTLATTGGVLLITLIAAGGAGWVAARQVIYPIEALVRAVRKITTGDLTQQVQIRTPAEIGVLAEAFNTMTARLRQTLQGLESLNAELDQRVVERTAELQQANTRLTELDRLKTHFITDISHELRTPLTVITTSAYLLRRSPPERHAAHLDKLERQIERLNQFVGQVFDISRLDEMSDSPVFKPVSLNAIVSDVVSDFAPRAEVAGLELVVEQDEDLEAIMGESSQLIQVVSNLINNAIDYTLTGKVEIRTQTQGAGVCLQVRDTGRGIAPEDIAHLFERFYRGKGVGSSNMPGSGLGLSIVKQIVDLHRGSIAVESQVDQGTTFRVWLPSRRVIA